MRCGRSRPAGGGKAPERSLPPAKNPKKKKKKNPEHFSHVFPAEPPNPTDRGVFMFRVGSASVPNRSCSGPAPVPPRSCSGSAPMQSEWRRLGPAHWRALTHKRAVVHARNGDELRGFIVTVDPVSASLVLLDLDGSEVQMVLGHAVKQVQILDQNLDSAQKTRLELFRDPDPGQDWSLDLDRTRTRLLDWIRLNRIPVETEGAGIVVAGGVVTVNPPFRVLDCVGQNQVVLDRVQRLIQNQPKDQDQDPDQDKDPDQDQSQNQDQDSAWSEPEPNQN